MRDPKKVYEYYNNDTEFETTDKKLALVVYEYFQKNDNNELIREIKQIRKEMKVIIDKLKKDIEDEGFAE